MAFLIVRGLALASLLALLPAFGPTAARAADSSAEYQLKAAFLYRFAQFTEWPAGALGRSDSLVLCVLGEDPFGGALGGIEGHSVHQRPLAIRRLGDAQQINQCHIAFLGPMRPDALGQAIRRGRQFNVLTVSDAKNFAAVGGAIQFVVVNDRIQFEINHAAAEQAGLKLSSHLLKLARTVYTSLPE